MDNNQNNNGKPEGKKSFLTRCREGHAAFCEKHPRISKAVSFAGTVIGIGAVSAGAAVGTTVYLDRKKATVLPEIPAEAAETVNQETTESDM